MFNSFFSWLSSIFAGSGASGATEPWKRPLAISISNTPEVQQLKASLLNNERDHYLEENASYYDPYNGMINVKYDDSGLIHTEGQFYATFLLAFSQNNGAQQICDKIWNGAVENFPAIQNSSILAWLATDDDSAADADVFRIVSAYLAAVNQSEGKWQGGNVNYKKETKKLSKDFLDKEVIYTNGLAIPLSGIHDSSQDKSFFYKETDIEFIFQYNLSYSFLYAANLLRELDGRWAKIAETQIKINKSILQILGIVDWCVVKVSKRDGAITVENSLDALFPHRDPDQKLEPRKEWPRFILDITLTYIWFNDAKVKELIDVVEAKYSLNLNGLSYMGYRNELVISLICFLKIIKGSLTSTDVTQWKSQVCGAKNYYGNPHYNSSKHTFQQLIVGMIVQQMNQILS